MNCDQIRPLLNRFVQRDLPTYKVAWVAQHLAGCEVCRTLAQELEPAPVATAVESASAWSSGPGEEAASFAVQRRVPCGVRLAGALAVLVLGAAAVAAVRVTADRADSPRPAALVSNSVSAQGAVPGWVPAQTNLGVTLSLESVVAVGEQVTVNARFRGRSLGMPPEREGWVRVFGANRQEILDVGAAVVADAEGLLVEARFTLPDGQDRFLLRVAGVSQESWQRWQLTLPDPSETVVPPGQLMSGSPTGTRLVSYRVESELLQVRVRIPAWQEMWRSPAFQLRDAEGALYTSIGAEDTEGFGEREIQLRFPLPREIRTPFTLIGHVPTRKQIGPWLIEGAVVK